MTSRILEYLRDHALAAAAFVCSILALAGSSYAAFTISGSQIRNGTINPVKFNSKYVNGTVRAWAIVSPTGQVIRGKGGPKVTPLAGDPGGYGIRWGVKVGRCETNASVDFSSSPPGSSNNPSAPSANGYAVASTASGASGRGNETVVQTFDWEQSQPTAAPLGFDVAVIC